MNLDLQIKCANIADKIIASSKNKSLDEMFNLFFKKISKDKELFEYMKGETGVNGWLMILYSMDLYNLPTRFKKILDENNINTDKEYIHTFVATFRNLENDSLINRRDEIIKAMTEKQNLNPH